MPDRSAKPSKSDLQRSQNKTIPDQLAKGLKVLFCGINPSLYSAAVGHHFARPGNRFWPALFDSGFTPRLFEPSEDHLLPEHGCGLTNLVARATARADELSAQELREGHEILIEKIKTHTPKALAVVGITAYRTAFGDKHAQMGRQSKTIGETLIWILPNPSGLNAHYQRGDFKRLFKSLLDAL